jgi:hypothetical protein
MQDLVEGGGELRVVVTDQELDRLSLAIRVHQQVAGLLSHPHAGRVRVTPRIRMRLLACSITART